MVGADITGTDQGAAEVLAASLGGRVITYSSSSVLQFSAFSPSDLQTKLASLNNVDFASAQANATLAQALTLNSVSYFIL